jgi:hypothetical protein
MTGVTKTSFDAAAAVAAVAAAAAACFLSNSMLLLLLLLLLRSFGLLPKCTLLATLNVETCLSRAELEVELGGPLYMALPATARPMTP